MQKKIIALAIAAAFAAPVAMADTANVNVYGVVNMSADNVLGLSGANTGVDTRNYESRGRVSSNNSFIGFKGSEDMGDGLSAVWQIESSIAMDAGALNSAGTRNTFGGLSSKTLGALTFGVIDTPLKISTGPLAEFTNTLADYRTLFTTNNSSRRPDSSALYVSPSMGGFVVRALYSAANEAGNNVNATGALSNRSDPTLTSFSGTYTDGPIFAVLAAENTQGVVGDNKTQATRAGFGYTFGDAKVGVATENYEVANRAEVKSTDVRSIYVSASYKMGLNTLKAAVTQRGDNKGNTTQKDGARQLTVGVDRALSKRTTVYALATKVDNDTNGAYALAGGATGVAAVNAATGGNARGVSFGMSHSF